MKRTYLALLLAACGGSGGGGSTAIIDDTVLTVEHRSGVQPIGYLQVQAGGEWLYGNSDACTHMQGEMEPGQISDIERWVNDDSLKPYVNQKACADTDYVIKSATSRMCWAQNAMPDSESARSLVAIFSEYAGKLQWDGVKRECNTPNLTATPSGNVKQTDAPPPSRMSVAAGSGG